MQFPLAVNILILPHLNLTAAVPSIPVRSKRLTDPARPCDSALVAVCNVASVLVKLRAPQTRSWVRLRESCRFCQFQVTASMRSLFTGCSNQSGMTPEMPGCEKTENRGKVPGQFEINFGGTNGGKANEGNKSTHVWSHRAIEPGGMGSGVPRTELGVDYSYVRYSPALPYSKGHSLNGGGGSATFNLDEYLGIKVDLQGYGSNLTSFNISPNPTFPDGLNGNVQGNLFTYLFGPQIKIRAHNFQPFGNFLIGGAHTNVYGNAFRTLCQHAAGNCGLSTAPAADAFALKVGVGLDIPINKTISFSACRARLPHDSLQQPAHKYTHSEQFSLLGRPYVHSWPH